MRRSTDDGDNGVFSTPASGAAKKATRPEASGTGGPPRSWDQQPQSGGRSLPRPGSFAADEPSGTAELPTVKPQGWSRSAETIARQTGQHQVANVDAVKGERQSLAERAPLAARPGPDEAPGSGESAALRTARVSAAGREGTSRQEGFTRPGTHRQPSAFDQPRPSGAPATGAPAGQPPATGQPWPNDLGTSGNQTRPIDFGAQTGLGEPAPYGFPGEQRPPATTQVPGRGPDPRSAPAAGGYKPADTQVKYGAAPTPIAPRRGPNRLLLGVVALLLIGAGLAAFWWFTQQNDADPASEEIAADSGDAVPESAGVDGATDGTGAATLDPVAPEIAEPQFSEPTLIFDDAINGPLELEEPYSIAMGGLADGDQLQVVVDGRPQGTPGSVLPTLIFPQDGRHTLSVNVTRADGTTVSSNTIDAYVLGLEPDEGYTANLASINILEEGWEEAISRFDGYRDAGHDGVRMLPLTPGYWNIFVPGFGESQSAVQEYCAGFDLAFPDDCFARYYNAGDYTPPPAALEAAERRAAEAAGAEEAEASSDESTSDGEGDTDDGSMTEDGDTSSGSGG